MDMETVTKDRKDIIPIRIETMQMVEGVAFGSLQDTMVEVFKHRGMAGLAPFLERFLHELETFARECCGRSWDEYMQRAIVSSRLATEYLPKTRAALDAYRDSRGDYHRRMATWDTMLVKVSTEDRAFIESIKEADSVLNWLLTSKAACDLAETQRLADLATQSKAARSTRRYVR